MDNNDDEVKRILMGLLGASVALRAVEVGERVLITGVPDNATEKERALKSIREDKRAEGKKIIFAGEEFDLKAEDCEVLGDRDFVKNFYESIGCDPSEVSLGYCPAGITLVSDEPLEPYKIEKVILESNRIFSSKTISKYNILYLLEGVDSGLEMHRIEKGSSSLLFTDRVVSVKDTVLRRSTITDEDITDLKITLNRGEERDCLDIINELMGG